MRRKVLQRHLISRVLQIARELPLTTRRAPSFSRSVQAIVAISGANRAAFASVGV